MLTPKIFLNLVEIQTKIASLFPFLIGTLFTYDYFGTLNWLVTGVFFASMLIFDMTTTGINNLIDYKKATNEDYKKNHNIIGTANLSEKGVAILLVCMLAIATGLGLWLVYLTDIFVLLIGAICFFIGIFYTYGPLPLSRLPLGEVFSGVTMGFGILFLVVYINVPHLNLIVLYINSSTGLLSIHLDLVLLATIALVAIPPMLTISNIMLANNICDLEQDIKNNRHTLPYFIGKDKAVYLFEICYIAAYMAILIAFTLNLYSWYAVAVFGATLVPIYKNLAQFRAKQIKSQTFVVSIKNMVLINGATVVALGLAILL